MKVNIGIDTKTFIRFWLVVIGFALVGLLVYHARTGIAIVLTSIFLSVALNPIVSLIAKKLPGKSRTLATTIAYLFVILVLGLILFLVLPTIVSQVTKFAQSLPSLIEGSVNQWSGLTRFASDYGLGKYLNEFFNSLEGLSTTFARNLGSNVMVGAGSLIAIFTNTLLTLFLTFLMLIEGPGLVENILTRLDKNKQTRRARNVIKRMYKVVTSFVTGQLLVALISGVVTSLVMFLICLIFNISASLAIPVGVLVSVLSLIPVFGATIGAVIAAILIALNSVGAAIVFVVYFIIYQQIENNLIVPTVQSKASRLPAVVVLMSVIIGIYTFGLIGGIIAIPIAGFIRVWVEEYADIRLSKRAAHSVNKPS
ncbi:AI-2E family transporter [Candidatus Saccharibacteria bacterium]|nr:AI-2E family transporter [Candidatus Saccharibacteria bacterium]